MNTETGIAIDGTGNVHVTGVTGSSDFPTTAGAFDVTFGGGFYDGFVTKLEASGAALVYSTYLGGSEREEVAGIAVDGAGNAYVTGDNHFDRLPNHAGCLRHDA